MLHLRRYEQRSGLWTGWVLPYPSLYAIEYLGDRMVSLDFGSRQFVIEGLKLEELVRHFQRANVLSVQEYAPDVWPTRPSGPIVASIRRVSEA